MKIAKKISPQPFHSHSNNSAYSTLPKNWTTKTASIREDLGNEMRSRFTRENARKIFNSFPRKCKIDASSRQANKEIEGNDPHAKKMTAS